MCVAGSASCLDSADAGPAPSPSTCALLPCPSIADPPMTSAQYYPVQALTAGGMRGLSPEASELRSCLACPRFRSQASPAASFWAPTFFSQGLFPSHTLLIWRLAVLARGRSAAWTRP